MDFLRDISHPILILVRGLPGSGKTYIAVELQKMIGSDVVMLDPDATDYNSKEYADHVRKATEEGVDPKLHAYRFLRAQAYEAIKEHKIIVWNQPFTNQEIFHKMVTNLQKQADEHHTDLPVLVVEVEIDQVIAKQRVQSRKQKGGHGPSETTFDRFVRDYKSFADDGYTTVTVNGEDDVFVSVGKVVSALRDLVKG